MSKSTSGARASTIPAITNVGGGGSTEVGGGLTVTTVPPTTPGQPPTTVISIEDNPVLSGVVSAGGLLLSAAATLGQYLANIFQPSLAVGQINGFRVGRNADSAYQSSEISYYHNSNTPAATDNFAGLGLWGAPKLKIDGDANVFVPGILTVNGGLSTSGYQAYIQSTTSTAPSGSFETLTGWTGRLTSIGRALTAQGNGFFLNQTGQTMTISVTFTGRRMTSALGKTEFRVYTTDGGGSVWGVSAVSATDFCSVAAIVRIAANNSLAIQGYQDSGSAQTYGESYLSMASL